MTSFLIRATLIAAMFGLSACSSKKKVDDSAQGGGAPSIESTPMSFDATGSDSGTIAGLYTVNFEYDRSALTSDARAKLAQNIDWMKTNSKANLQIEGHCDARGSVEYNLSLGERRAKAVKDYMVANGVAAGRLSIISYGKEKLLAQGDSEEDHSRNRRANFVPLNQ